jgi:hypothetical protein
VLSVDDTAATETPALDARIANLTLRLMENWRQPFKDGDSVMILLAMAAISGEKLTRARLERVSGPGQAHSAGLANAVQFNSIAAATGLNRETTRRKVNKLAAAGLIVRADDGSVSFSPGFSQRHEPIAIVRAQLETLRRTANELIRDDVLIWSGDDL